MADIPSEENRIQTQETQFRAAVAESTLTRIGASINFLLDGLAAKKLKTVEFLANGTWQVPADVESVILEGCGGGGGAGFQRIVFSGTTHQAREAGFGAPFVSAQKTVVPMTNVNITIGSGGAGPGLVTTNSDVVAFGGNGGDTIFDDGSPFVMPGGLGGTRLDEMTYLSGPPSSAQKVQGFIETILYTRLLGRSRFPNESKGMFDGSVSAITSNLPLVTPLRDFVAQGSLNGFRNTSLANNGLNVPNITSPGQVAYGGSGPYGASTASNGNANSGAGGSILQNTATTATLFSGGSGRLKIHYVSRF